jgi:hypothetical protein
MAGPEHTIDGTEGGAVELTPEFVEAVRRWENAPHNREGANKTWVERLMEESRRHHRLARRVR